MGQDWKGTEMKKLLYMLLIIGAVYTPTVYSHDDNKKTDRKIKLLEDKVKKLEQELSALKELVYKKFNLEIKSSAPAFKGATSCTDRLSNLKDQLQQLQTEGYKDKHPYVQALKTQIKKLSTTCQK